jgi:hypothetical protein
MVDVAPDLRVYDRSIPLPSDRLISHVKTILSALARFHALWEQPEQQERIERMNWLLPFDNYVWRKSSFYATILGEAVVGGFSQVTPV